MPPHPKPILAPLKTSKSPTFPSEIHPSPLPQSAKMEAIKGESAQKTPITPPQAYTDYLRTLTPILTSALPSATTEKMSALSQPSTTTSASFSHCLTGRSTGTSITIPSPSTCRRPHSARTPRCRRAIGASPITTEASPRSASSLRSPFSPSDWTIDSGIRYFDSPRSANSGRRVSMRQVVTQTITYKKAIPLDPAPKGKRRKIEKRTKAKETSETE